MSKVGMSIDTSSTQVIVQFNEPISWLGLSPDNAIELAYALYEKAVKMKEKKDGVIKLPPRLNG